MFSKTLPIQIKHIQTVNLRASADPLLQQVLVNLIKSHLEDPYAAWGSGQPIDLASSKEEKPRLFKAVDYAGKVLSIFSSVALIAFIALLWSGKSAIGPIQMDSLLTIFAFTLVGGLISVGGVQVFSINASLRRANEKMRQALKVVSRGPKVHMVVRIESRSDDPRDISRLQVVQAHSNRWFEEYISVYITTPAFRADIAKEVDLRQDWKLMSVRPVDNIDRGLLLELTFQKDMSEMP